MTIKPFLVVVFRLIDLFQYISNKTISRCCIRHLQVKFKVPPLVQFQALDRWPFVAEFIAESIFASSPVPEAVKQPQAITAPLPCFTVVRRFLA